MSHLYFNEYVDANTPYKFQNYTSQSTDYKDYFTGLGDINNNYRYTKFIGRDRYNSLFTERVINYISTQITSRLTGVHPEGKNIIVPTETILSVTESVYNKTTNAELEVMTEMVINFIVNQIKTEYDTIQKNNKLSIWITNYDVSSGMQRFNSVKLNNKQRNHYMMWKY